jgi:hypothetical protein
MNINIFIAILGGLINMILSLIIPYLLKNTNTPLLTQINTIYTTNKQLIITSSLIVALTIYIALSVGPNMDEILSSWMESQNNNNNNNNNNIRIRFSDLAFGEQFNDNDNFERLGKSCSSNYDKIFVVSDENFSE